MKPRGAPRGYFWNALFDSSTARRSPHVCSCFEVVPALARCILRGISFLQVWQSIQQQIKQHVIALVCGTGSCFGCKLVIASAHTGGEEGHGGGKAEGKWI